MNSAFSFPSPLHPRTTLGLSWPVEDEIYTSQPPATLHDRVDDPCTELPRLPFLSFSPLPSSFLSPFLFNPFLKTHRTHHRGGGGRGKILIRKASSSPLLALPQPFLLPSLSFDDTSPSFLTRFFTRTRANFELDHSKFRKQEDGARG